MAVFLLALFISEALIYVQAQIPAIVVQPQEMESVNGSSADIRCTTPLVDSGSFMLCEECSANTLVDGKSPAIDTSTSDWAFQLVTVRKTQTDEITANDGMPFDHVLLTFRFETLIQLNAIELDLFLCPEWGIGAPFFSVYADKESNLVFTSNSLNTLPFKHYTPSQSSCGSLSTVTISLGDTLTSSSYLTWHILVSSFTPFIYWVHVGEVRFFKSSGPDPMCPSPTSSIAPSTSHLICSDCVSHPTPSISTTTILTFTTESNPPSKDNGGVVAGVISIVAILAVVGLCIGAVVYRRHYKQKHTPNDDFSIVNNNSSPQFQSLEPHIHAVDMRGNHETELDNINGVKTEDDASELPNYDDLTNPVYEQSGEARVKYMGEEGLYDEVPKEDLGANGPSNDYEDTKSVPHSSAPSAPPLVEETSQPDFGTTAVYSHVHKKNPVVPLKSTDLEEFLKTQDTSAAAAAANNSTEPSPPHRKSSLQSLLSRRPKLSRISENPVYDRGMSGESKALLDSSTGEEMYDRPPNNPREAFPEDDTESPQAPQVAAPPPLEENVYNMPLRTQQDSATAEELENGPIYAPVYAVPSKVLEQPIMVTSENIVVKKELGMGQFGRVVLAATNGLSLKDMHLSETDDNRDISIFVAVKKLPAKPSLEERQMFEKEVKFMSSLKHSHIVSLIGVCHRDPAFIMMEYMEDGDLSQFLQRYNEIVPISTFASKTQITTSTLVFMATQIAGALKYLASHNFVHRDLACRNCLVGENFTVKLADFGMSRNLYQSHYYRIQGNAVLPIRWMATESFFGIFSEKTDVWAFGITMWELFTLAKEDPYSHLTDSQVVDDAVKGVHRLLLSRPEPCPKSVFKIMQQCWAADPKERANFEAVEEMLQTYWYTPEATM